MYLADLPECANRSSSTQRVEIVQQLTWLPSCCRYQTVAKPTNSARGRFPPIVSALGRAPR